MSTMVQESPAKYGVRDNFGTQRVLLRGVSWATYEALLRDTGDHRGSRLFYDRGDLEIMSPGMKHEQFNLTIHDFIVIAFDELEVNYAPAGHMTCKREDLERGLEPDCSYYIRNEPAVRGKDEIDLTVDPPPDLMVEVDVTTDSEKKLAACAAIGIPEHWIYDGQAIVIRSLVSGSYVENKRSSSFPGLDIATGIVQFLKTVREKGNRLTLREFRAWVRKNKRKKRS